MPGRRTALWTFFALAGLSGGAQAEAPPRLKASWKEKDARVEIFSPDGRSLVSSGADGHRLRDAETGQVRAVLSSLPHRLHGLRFSPDGQLLYAQVASEEHKPVNVFDLKAWDVATGRTYGTIPYTSESINAVTDHFALSPDGKTLATLDNSERLPMQVERSKVGLDGREEFEIAYNASPGLPRVRIWSVPEWKPVALLDGGSHMVFSPDGAALATGSRDWRTPEAKVWDTATWRLRTELGGEAQWVKPMAFSPDGKFLAISGRGDETLWDLGRGEKWMVPAKNGGSRAPVFSLDGGLLFPSGLPSGDPARNMNVEFPCYDLSSAPPRRLDFAKGQHVVQPLDYKGPRLLVSPTALKFIAFEEADARDERAYEVCSLPDRLRLARSTVRGLERAEFSPDGSWVALLVWRREAGDGGPGPRPRMEVQVVDSTSASLLATIPSPGQTWGNYGWTSSPDGKSLAVHYRTGTNEQLPGEDDPLERPMQVDVWEIRP